MTGLFQAGLDLLSRRLCVEEREAVLGDFLDAGTSGPRALLELAGLVARRELALWAGWRPWLALVAVVCPLVLMMCLFFVPLMNSYQLYAWIIGNYPHFDRTMLEQTGLTPERGIVLMLRKAALLGLWSWTSGFVMGKLAGRSVWVHAVALSVLTWGLLLWLAQGMSLPTPAEMLVIGAGFVAAPLAFGTLRGMRKDPVGLPTAVFSAIALLALVVVSAGQGAWNWTDWRTTHGALHLGLRWLLCWPTAYLVAAALRAERMGENYDTT